MLRITRISLIPFFIFFVSGYAQQLLTIQDAVSLAFEKNPQLLSLKNNAEITSAEKVKSFGISTPTVSFMKEGIPSGGNQFVEKRWMVSQNIDSPIKSFFSVKSYDDELRAIENKILAKRIELKKDVKSKYVDVIYAIHILKLSNEQVELATDLYNAVFSRVEAGVSNELELLKAKIKLEEAENDKAEAEKNKHYARYELFNTIGMDTEKQKYSITYEDTLHYSTIDLSEHKLLSVILEQPELRAIDEKINAAQNRKSAAISSYFPNFNLMYYWQDFGQGFKYHGYEIGMSFPIWFFMNESKDVNIASNEIRILELEKRKTILDIKKEIEQVWHSFKTSRETIKRYESSIQSKAEDLLNLTTEGYRMGELGLLSFLDAQETFLSSKLRYYRSLKDYYVKLIELEKYLDHDLVY